MHRIQVNIPFTMLYDSYLPRFIEYGINPEVGFDAEALERFSLSDFKGIAEQLHAHGLSTTLHAPFMDLSPGSLDPAVRALTRHRFEQVLELVGIFRPKSVVCHTGYEKKRYEHIRESWVENSLETWTWLSSHMRQDGARLMLENVYEQGPDDIRIFFDRLGDQGLGFCLDTGHQAAYSITPLETWVQSLGQFLGQLHLHDNCGKEDEHLAVGEGCIDFQSFFRLLKALRKEPPIVTLEPHVEEDLWPSIEYLEKFWPW
jgi:sugar phosphate isomerase/epimerase